MPPVDALEVMRSYLVESFPDATVEGGDDVDPRTLVTLFRVNEPSGRVGEIGLRGSDWGDPEQLARWLRENNAKGLLVGPEATIITPSGPRPLSRMPTGPPWR